MTGFSRGINDDYATVKYSGAGLPLWTNRYNGPLDSNDTPTGLAVDPHGDVIVTGWALGLPYYNWATIKYAETSPIIVLRSPSLTKGVFSAWFTYTSGAVFTLLATSNLNLPLSSWSTLGSIVESPPGRFTFTDVQTTNNPQRFYRIRLP